MSSWQRAGEQHAPRTMQSTHPSNSLAFLNTFIRCATSDRTLYVTLIESLQIKRAPLMVAVSPESRLEITKLPLTRFALQRIISTSEASPVQPYIIEFQQLHLHSLRTLQSAPTGVELSEALRQAPATAGEEAIEGGLLDSMLLVSGL